MRLTNAFVSVAVVLLSAPGDRQWGYALSRSAGVRPGVLYPLLKRMLDQGWVEDGWENPAEIEEKRPPRRYYTVTEAGLQELGAAVRRARNDVRFRAVQQWPAVP